MYILLLHMRCFKCYGNIVLNLIFLVFRKRNSLAGRTEMSGEPHIAHHSFKHCLGFLACYIGHMHVLNVVDLYYCH
jgi:hypothetical protein